MTSDQTTNPAPPPAASGKRHSTGVVIGAAVAGLALGALGVFMLAGITWKIRVEFPPALSGAVYVSPAGELRATVAARGQHRADVRADRPTRAAPAPRAPLSFLQIHFKFGL